MSAEGDNLMQFQRAQKALRRGRLPGKPVIFNPFDLFILAARRKKLEAAEGAKPKG